MPAIKSGCHGWPGRTAISKNSKEVTGQTVDPFAMVRRIKGRGPAPVHLWDPPFCGDMDMEIARDGTWIHEGKPIRRAALVGLFASVLKLEDDGHYYLVTPVEKVRIRVVDCPFVAVDMDVEGEGSLQNLTFTTNTGEKVVAGEGHRLSIQVQAEGEEPHPIVHVRSGLNALINRAVFYRLIDLAQSRTAESAEPAMGIWSGGQFFAIGD